MKPVFETDEPLRATLEDARKRFLVMVGDLRPRLHRFCARMTGSVLDGEDLVQETLAQGFYSLGALKDRGRLEPWLFRIAHNKCVDFLRREADIRNHVEPIEDDVEPGHVEPDEPEPESIDEAFVALVSQLPPMERASVLLKDVLGYPLADIAPIVDSTVGGVKAALHRGRGKLKDHRSALAVRELDHEERALLAHYIGCFNRRDWDGLQRLIQADARLEVVGVSEGTPATSYFRNYAAQPWEWKFTLARVDGAPVVVMLRKAGPDWIPHSAVRLWWHDGRVVRIRDYVHVDYLLTHARTELERPDVSPTSSTTSHN